MVIYAESNISHISDCLSLLQKTAETRSTAFAVVRNDFCSSDVSPLQSQPADEEMRSKTVM